METTILSSNDLHNLKNGVLIKQWERGKVTLYMHVADTRNNQKDVALLEVTELDNGLKEYNYANQLRSTISDLNPIGFLNKHIIPFYDE